jgi:hypothetical protein
MKPASSGHGTAVPKLKFQAAPEHPSAASYGDGFSSSMSAVQRRKAVDQTGAVSERATRGSVRLDVIDAIRSSLSAG